MNIRHIDAEIPARSEYLTLFSQLAESSMMVDRTQHFHDLLTRLKSGDQDAAAQVVKEYGPHIYRAIRRRFRSQKFKILYNSDDCMQSVWGWFFSNAAEFDKCDTPKHLINYLARTAANKLIDQQRHLNADRNDIDREAQLDDSEAVDQFGLVDPCPTPSHRVSIKEQYDFCTQGLSPEKRTIVALYAEGHTSEEIPEKLNLNVSPRTVRRVLEDLFKRLRHN